MSTHGPSTVKYLEQRLAVFSWLIAVCVLIPIEIHWFRTFYRHRRQLIIQKRLPKLLLVQLLYFWFYTLCRYSMWIFQYKWHWDINEVHGPPWDDTQLYISYMVYVLISGFIGISLARWWLLYFMIKRSSILKGSKWMNIINPRYVEQDWYFRHRQTHGAWRWIRWPLSVYGFTAAVTGSTSWYFVNRNSTSSSHDTIIYWICNIWYLIYVWALSLIVIFSILKRIPILDDAIGLKKELRIISYFWIILVVLVTFVRVINPILILIFKDLGEYEPIITQISVLMLRLCQFGINYMSTGWVVRKFKFILRRQSRVSRMGTNPVSIMLSTRGFRKKLHESTLCLIEADKPLCPDEEEERMEFKRSLTEMAVFEGFMRHLFKEYSHENLLSVIEMMQFKHRVLYEEISAEKRYIIEHSMHKKLTKHFLAIPDECAKSAIVYGEDGLRCVYKWRAREIFLKYVKKYSPYEINVEDMSRNELAHLIESLNWKTNEEYNDPVNL